MDETTSVDPAIMAMPRGGPDASWLDRRLQTETLEYTDRYDIPDEVKQAVVTALDRMGTRSRQHEYHARTALELVDDLDSPRILELGAGHGRLSAKILELHPSATVTVSDLDPTSVANISAGELGKHPRARAQVIDATAIDAADDSYDLVVFAQAFHHLPPGTAARAIAEATRVARRFLVIDIQRPSIVALLLMAVIVPPIATIATAVRPSLRRFAHDGYISMLRSYSPSAFSALGRAADPALHIEFLQEGPRPPRRGPRTATVVFSRPQRAG